MSDIDSHSYARNASPWADIRTGLSEVERRLSELQGQLGASTGVLGAAPQTTTLDFEPSISGLPDSVSMGLAASPFDADPFAARRNADTILATARAGANEVLNTAEARVSLIKEQIDQLLLARETLRKSLRSALADCESSLQRLEGGEQAQSFVGEGASRVGQVPTGLATQGGHPSSEGAATMADALGIQTTTARLRSSVVELDHSGPPEVFEGSVSLRVGPLRDISQVDTLEIALLQLPGAERVEVKEFAGRDAVATIKLFQPVPLVEELRRVLPFQFEVSEGGVDSLTLIAVENGDAGRLGESVDSTARIGGE